MAPDSVRHPPCQNLDVVASTRSVQSLAASQTPGSPEQGPILSPGSWVTEAQPLRHRGTQLPVEPAADPENSP